MSAQEVDSDAHIAHCGETLIVEVGEAIPDRALVLNALMAVGGTPSLLLRLRAIMPEDMYHFADLTLRGTKVYTRGELDAIRPLAFVLPDRGWRSLRRFVEGGLYQAWPNGRVFRVQHGHLVDPYTSQPAARSGDRRLLAALIPVFIERWVPPALAEETEEEA